MKKILLVLLTSFITVVFAQSQSNIKTFGYIRTFHESAFDNGTSNFKMKMARLGVKGNLNEQFSYKVFFDLARDGSANYLLDAFAAYKPTKNFTFTVGQFKIPFGSDNLLAASKIPFSNRPLLKSATPGLRDLGAMGSFKFDIGIPVDLHFAVFNGVSLNTSEDDKTTNYVSRIVFNPIKKLNLSANYYTGKMNGEDTDFMNFGIDFKIGKIWGAGEYSVKTVKKDQNEKTNSYFAYVVYDIPTENKFLSYIQPGLRIGSLELDELLDENKTARVTFGLTFQFNKNRSTHFRINYENYELLGNSSNSNKLILESQIKF